MFDGFCGETQKEDEKKNKPVRKTILARQPTIGLNPPVVGAIIGSPAAAGFGAAFAGEFQPLR
jgi:hypothetical protein